jgi:hypothetical protein
LIALRSDAPPDNVAKLEALSILYLENGARVNGARNLIG